MMKMRFVHLIVVAALVVAAVNVYTIKYESAVRAEQVAKLAAEIKRERERIAALRAEWATLDNPARIQALVHRHLALKMLDPAQIEHLDRLPERPPVPLGPQSDAIAAIIDGWEGEPRTGAAPPPPGLAPQAEEGRERAAAGATR
jgi:cell division protein FtsL